MKRRKKKIKFNPYSTSSRTEALEMEEKTVRNMDKDFVRDIDFIIQQSKLKGFIYRDKKIIEYLSDLDMNGSILDIGERNPLTERIEEAFGISIDSTIGDLDGVEWWISGERGVKMYDMIIFSHVIEHLFNPLFCIESIKMMMKQNALLIICTPIKSHLIPWGKGHFHEFDDYRFKKLIERAGLKIIRWEKFSNYRWNTLRSYRGFRPLLRMFFKEQSFIELKIK